MLPTSLGHVRKTAPNPDAGRTVPITRPRPDGLAIRGEVLPRMSGRTAASHKHATLIPTPSLHRAQALS